MKLPSSIYVLTSRELSGLDHVDQVQFLLAAGVRVIQLREKQDPSSRWFQEQARACVRLARGAGAVLIINDDPQLAVKVDAHGIHIGQDDMSPATARDVIGSGRILGLSTHNVSQFEKAITEPVDYIAVGPVFGTTTKANPDPATGLDLVRAAAARIPSNMQLVAIGGITSANLRSLLDASQAVIPAVIGGVFQHTNPAQACRELLSSLSGDPSRPHNAGPAHRSG